MNILVVEDDNATRKVVSLLIEQMGHLAIEVATGEEAWSLLTTRTDLPVVLTDRIMPGISGDSLIRRIRAANPPHYTYVILLTSKNTPDDIVDGLESGADDYLVKPFNPRELQARISIGVRLIEMERSLRETRDDLAHLATYDPLMEVYNRRAITACAENAIQQVSDTTRPACLILLDIDHFKQVNDRYGHIVGDEALRLIALTLKSTLSEEYAVGRWGGEEFLIVLPDTTIDAARHVAVQLCDAIGHTSLVLSNGSRLHFSVSLGITEVSVREAAPLNRLIKRADDALYRAKREGRSRIALELQSIP